MKEVGVVVEGGEAVYWHLPIERSARALPDSAVLWRVLWARRGIMDGVAHSHPGAGQPHPSREDLTTFAGVEAGLGRRLKWWITSADMLIELNWVGPTAEDYASEIREDRPPWLERLRALSREEGP